MHRAFAFRGSANLPSLPPEGGGVPSLPNIGLLSIYAYTICRTTTKFDVVTLVRDGHVSWGHLHLPSRDSGVSALPSLRVLVYLCLHPLTHNGRGVFLGVQPCYIAFAQMRHAVCQR